MEQAAADEDEGAAAYQEFERDEEDWPSAPRLRALPRRYPDGSLAHGYRLKYADFPVRPG